MIECARGQTARTRLTRDGRTLEVRALPDGVRYPFNYGYLEGTRVDDGEEIDVFVLGPARAPGSRLAVAVVGAVAFADGRGDDPKLLAVAVDGTDRQGGTPPAAALASAAAAVADFLRRYKGADEPRTVGGLVPEALALGLVARARVPGADAGDPP